MKKRKITVMALLLALSLTLSSCSLFSNKPNNPDNKSTTASEENNSLDKGNKKDNDAINPGDNKQESEEEKIKAEEEKKKAEEEKIKAEEEKKKAEEEKKKAEEEKKKAEEEKKKNANSNNNRTGKTGSNKSSKNIEPGQLVTTNKSVDVYTNAADAKSRTNPVKTYPAGQYYIYKVHDGMANISLKKDSAGGWVNPQDINLSVSSGSSNKNINSSNNKPSNKVKTNPGSKYSWSWLYPGKAGSALTKYGGAYRLSGGKNIYLTFDNGYEYKKNTSKILDSLSKTGVKAVFFTTSSFMKENPALIKRMVREGHVVGNHTQKHLNHNVSSASAIRADLVNWEKDYARIIGAKPSVKLFRPPEGKFNETSLSIAQSLGYKTVLWGFAYGDWDTNNQPSKKAALNKLMANNRPGNVLLLHSVSDTNVAILESYIKQTRAKGYNFTLLR